jgi:mannose-6-phosphate isomerase-like protein (cupin superfamily)
MGSPARGLYRSLADAPRADLVGRSIWTLTNLADGFGDATVSLARIWTGRMNAHAHSPGGEFMYVAAGGGRVWIEGIPLRLRRHNATFVPPGLLHNAENTRSQDLLIVGITAPGVVPGSYAEVPPILKPTGRLDSVGTLACHGVEEEADQGRGTVMRLDPPPGSFPLDVRHVVVSPHGAARTAAATRIWVAVGGRGSATVANDESRLMTAFSTLVASSGTPVTFRGGSRGLRLLELSLVS